MLTAQLAPVADARSCLHMSGETPRRTSPSKASKSHGAAQMEELTPIRGVVEHED